MQKAAPRKKHDKKLRQAASLAKNSKIPARKETAKKNKRVKTEKKVPVKNFGAAELKSGKHNSLPKQTVQSDKKQKQASMRLPDKHMSNKARNRQKPVKKEPAPHKKQR
ncbi:MAG: hypothetical protein J6I40_04625 [Mailhella sp.]|nr:hypothetical protein [Mailhella sp.]